MNRKQRRAAQKADATAIRDVGAPGGEAQRLLFEATRCEQQQKLDEAARIYKRALALDPNNAQACNNLASLLQRQGKTKEASVHFARTLALMPQLLRQYNSIRATLVALLPPLDQALRRQSAAWPQRQIPSELFDGSFDSVAQNELLVQLLKSIPVQDVALERLLTALRRSLLTTHGEETDRLPFICALAQQCFINEYVFEVTPEEDQLVDSLVAALRSRSPNEVEIATVAMYVPLHSLGNANSFLTRRWSKPVEAVLDLQVRAPAEEAALRGFIPCLTPIADRVSRDVQKQYEENPYPRWVYPPAQVVPKSLDQYLQEQFPTARFKPTGKTEALDVLVAGCGTGHFAITAAQKYLGARVLAVDLSLSSLCYAKRNTPPSIAPRIEYAQADILNLASLGRSFDVVDVSGVLHHMKDPYEGWRILLSVVRPGGLMHLGFYSEAGRADVVAAREFIARHGYGTTAAEIRRCRQDLLRTPLATVSRFNDFFTTSECRDLLFHVQETRVDIPAIKKFIIEQGVQFVGFEFELPVLQRYWTEFGKSGWSLGDLDRWNAIEAENPATFSGMYQFWIQKP